MGINRKHWVRWGCAIVCIMMLAMLFPSHCFAAGKTKTVRVAYDIAAGYQEGGDGDYKTGYGYEYLQKLARINGWKYEYVYGTFDELLTKLENGEVDLMGQLTYTDERAAKISFGTNEQGRKDFYLYVNSKNSTIDPSDYATLNGKKVGVCAGKVYAEKWSEWCEKNGISCTIVPFDYLDDLETALNEGKIDAVAEGRLQSNEKTADWSAALKFDAAAFYFGVNKNRPDLLEELNTAQSVILEENPFYNEKVQSRYMKPISSVSVNLNGKELQWLSEHGNHIKYGYLEGFPPLCYTAEDGTCHGVEADLLASIEEKYGETNITFEAVKFDDYHTMFAALKKGDISIAWPAYSDCSTAEQNGYSVTEPVVDVPMLLVYDGKYDDDTTKKIGVINTGSLPKIYAGIYYPDSEVLEYNSYEDAIKAVLNHEVGSVLYVSTTYNVDVLENADLQKLQMVTLSDSFGISLAVRPDDVVLSSILDKGILAFGEAGASHSLITNSVVNQDVTLKEYFAQHPREAGMLLLVGVLLMLGILFFVAYREASMRAKTSQAEREIFERLSNSDPLTGLNNRRSTFRECKELLKAYPDRPFVMTHIDMTHFRLFNTFFGDKAGDQLLCDVAEQLRVMSQDDDQWVYGRIDADVFCAFFPYDKEIYEKHLHQMLQYLKEYRTDFLIEPKVGMYHVTDPEMPIEAMFARATQASKMVQSNTPLATVEFDEKMEEELRQTQQTIQDMQRAVDEEQFQVYLQPKYSLRSKKPVGAEALVRWLHPERGMVSPNEFIPVFEGNGFITTLDQYMWEHVCHLLSKWKKEGRNVHPISVNVSRLSMYGSSTVEYLQSLVQKYDIEPQYLELELTESAYMDNPEEMKAQLTALREAGFTILLDDFGSGFSSLNTLRELPVDVLKLDMKFLSLENRNSRGGVVLTSIIQMAERLDLEVIAEGVETQEQADYLLSVGCKYVQGYLFAKPMPVPEYERLAVDGEKPEMHVNEPVVSHIGRILAETGSATYSMGMVIPTPLACVEYDGQSFDFLRVNPAFYSEFEILDEGGTTAFFLEHVDEESRNVLCHAFDESKQSGKKQHIPVRWTGRDGAPRLYICSVAYEGDIDDMAAMVLTFTNATETMRTIMSDMRRKTNPEMEAELWDCVKKLVSAKDLSSATNSILDEVLDYYKADRAYIFEFDWETGLSNNTYEICAPDVEPVIDTLQAIPLEYMDFWIQLFQEQELIRIEDLNDLVGDESRKAEYEILAPQGIRSLIAAPVYYNGKLVGFLGVDNPRMNLEKTMFIESLAFFCVNEGLREKEITNLEERSMHDSLTGAYNRNAWNEARIQLRKSTEPFSLMMLDLDDFKQVNDRYGHEVGDETLKRVVATLKSVFRSDDRVIRYGGDEFIVILRNSGSQQEAVFVEKVAQLNELLGQPKDGLPGVSMSAGIAFSDSCAMDDLLKNVDEALYHAKNRGKNQCRVYKG